jgi:hypothetical protein
MVFCRQTEAAIANGTFVGEIISLPVTNKKTTENMTNDEEVSR